MSAMKKNCHISKTLSRLEHIKAAPKYIGDGIRRYKQPKRNAYKITNNQYGGLLIDVPFLMNRMK